MSLSPEQIAPLRLIGHAHRSFARLVDGPLRELGFAMGQLPVLIALKHGQAFTQAELARIAQVEQPSMAQLLNRMERDGLVERIPDPADRRVRLVSLTDSARKRMPKAKAVMDAMSNEALKGFSTSDIQTLDALVKRINANLDALADRADDPA